VLHVVSGRRGLLLLPGVARDGQQHKRGTEQRDACGKRNLSFGLESFHDSSSFVRQGTGACQPANRYPYDMPAAW
jgi:hypothetical protein